MSSSVQLPFGSPSNPSVAIAEAVSPAELQEERSIISSVLFTVKEHRASILLSLLALTTGSAAVFLYYHSKASSLSKHAHQPPPASTPYSPHPLSSTVADLQHRASHSLRHRDYSAALTLLSQAISLTAVPPPFPPRVLSSLHLDRANVHFLLHHYDAAFSDASLSSSLPYPPTRSRALLLQGRSQMMRRLYSQASDSLVRAVHEEQRRQREEGAGDAEVAHVARQLLAQCRELHFLAEQRTAAPSPAPTPSPAPSAPAPTDTVLPNGVSVTPPPPPTASTRSTRSSSSAAPSNLAASLAEASEAAAGCEGSEGSLRPPSPSSPLSPVSPASPSILDAIRAVNATAEKKRRREEQKRRQREASNAAPHPKTADPVESKEGVPSSPPPISQWRESYRSRRVVV